MLERYFAGEIEGEELEKIRRHLGSCAECSSYVAGLEAQKADFLAKHPFASFTRAHAHVNVIPWYSRFLRGALRPALIPVYGVLMVTMVFLPMMYREDSPDVRFKGRIPVSFLLRRDGAVRKGSTTMKFESGDNIQVVFSIGEERYVSLLSVDSRGVISFYHPDPQSTTCSVHMPAGQKQPFPGSIILDDTPGDELVLVLFSGNALSVSSVSSWVKRNFKAASGLSKLKTLLENESAAIHADVSTLLLHKE